jgi:hypothetical protein
MSTQQATPMAGVATQKWVPPLFSTSQLRWLAIASLGVILIVCLVVVREPRYYEYEIVRFVVCFLLTVCLSIFFFIFWPQELKLTKVAVINLSVTVAGPVVLWFIFFLLLLFKMPPSAGSHWEFFAVSAGNSKSNVDYHTEIVVSRKDGKPLEFRLVQDLSHTSHLHGIFIEFPRGDDPIEADLKVPKYKPLPVTFVRNARCIDVSGLTRSDEQ